MGSAWNKTKGKILQWYEVIDTIKTHINSSDSIIWHGGGIAVPSPYIPGYPHQSHTWKLVDALYPMKTWTGYVSNNSGEFSVSFKINSTAYTQACVRLPSVLLKGTIKWNKTMRLLSCVHCPLFTCLNNSVMSISLMNLYTWIPVQLKRHWEESPSPLMLQNPYYKTEKNRKIHWNADNRHPGIHCSDCHGSRAGSPYINKFKLHIVWNSKKTQNNFG